MTDTAMLPIPSQYQIRAEVESCAPGDLPRPAGGEIEKPTKGSVRNRCLVGVFGPGRSGAANPSTSIEDKEIPLIPDELSESGSDPGDDGTTKSVKVTEDCGHHKLENLENRDDHKGNAPKIWQRYRKNGTVSMALKEGTLRFTISEPARREVLQRLLKLNHERCAEEVKQGLHNTKKCKAKQIGTLKKSTKSQSSTRRLFGDDDEEGEGG
jgi:hypothetical protein